MKRLVAMLLAAVLAATACTGGPGEQRLSVLASSELADLGPILDDLRADTGIRLDLDLQGTVDAGTALTPGQYHHDLAWLSTDRYFQLKLRKSGFTGERPAATRIMLSPIVIGVKPAVAAALRSRHPDVSWADFADAAAAGSLRFAMADPARSASGLSALVGVATAAAGTGAALRPQDVVCDRLRGFRTGQSLTATSSGALVDLFAAHQTEVDAVIGYESTLLSLNASGRLTAPLELIYPRDGIMQSEYPLLLLDPGKRGAYERVTDWLKRPETQRKIMERTLRRPATEGVPLEPRLPKSVGTALYFPDDQDVVDKLLAYYADPQGRTPGHVVFVLDFSGSMRGGRITALRTAFDALTGAGEAEFERFYRGEKITMIRFGGRVLAERDFAVEGPADLAAVRGFLDTEEFDSATAVWSALAYAYGKAAEFAKTEPVSIVLMTDGENNAGLGADEFLRRPAPPGVHTYAVRFGEADAAELGRVAAATGGRLADATATSLLDAFKETRGCR
ncbi:MULTISPECIES: vWA domain-containing protein [Amycolatopsis]|uniref:VWA domain-containing protein n=1 Tax=Amycolatopsis bullii TaxID=941987 RepID=A0ABQ3K607_9PSEU|nr:substrate-binding domain-containing protein [Amycolatopsis bullii]GHG03503.1 VWA domain-containing protein [Amycolatopsis bullii]